MRMRILTPVLAILVLFLTEIAAPNMADAFDNQKAANFLGSLQDRAIAQLGDNSVSEDEKEARFRELFNESFAVPIIGRFVVGRYWRGASEEDRAAFLKVFEDVIVQRFLPLLTRNTDKRLEIGNVTPETKKPNEAKIDTVFPRPEGEPYKVRWHVRETDVGYKILDIWAEGVSMAITLRSEYTTVIKSGGGKLSALTAALQEKVDEGAFAPE